MRSIHRAVGSGFALVSFAAAALVSASAAFGQGKAQMIVVDDGGTADSRPVIRHFSMPDLMDLREPDFIQRDLPIFQEKLLLSEAQATAFQRQIEVYLEAFAKLRKDILSFPDAEPMVIAGKAVPVGANGEAGEQGAGAIVIAPSNLDSLPKLSADDLDDMEGDVSFDIGVQIAIGDDEGGAAAPAQGGEPGVTVKFAGANGVELPEELRKKLEAQAQAIAEKIKKQIEEQQANGDGPLAALPGMGDMESFQRRQAEMAAAAKTFRKAKAELRQTFVAEAQGKLTADQIERWPNLERALLREKSLPKGRISGERTDLFKVLKALAIDAGQSGPVAEQLNSYDLALDAALRQRNDFLEDMSDKIDKAMSEQNFDKALSLMDRAAALRVAVRSANEQFAEAIAQLLPDATAGQFRSAVLKQSYPKIYRPTFAGRTFDAAKKIEGLDPQALAGLTELELAYKAELDEVNVKIRRTIDKYEPDEPRRPIEGLKLMSAGKGKDEMTAWKTEDPIRDAFARRRELDDRYVAAIRSMLTPEQVAQLPKQPAKAQRGEPVIFRRTIGD